MNAAATGRLGEDCALLFLRSAAVWSAGRAAGAAAAARSIWS
jgi:hypothetical protein